MGKIYSRYYVIVISDQEDLFNRIDRKTVYSIIKYFNTKEEAEIFCELRGWMLNNKRLDILEKKYWRK